MNKKIFGPIIAAFLLVMSITAVSAGHNNIPPGNDGNLCHGANKESCRPDPQPSHGKDCKPHGNNQDGNDDHCASPTPQSNPSSNPSPSVKPSPSENPGPSENPNPSVNPPGKPILTLPPTDTE